MDTTRYLVWTNEAEATAEQRATADQAAVSADLGYPAAASGAASYFGVMPSGTVWISPINTEFPADILPDKPRLTKAEANASGADIP